jgi:integrase
MVRKKSRRQSHGSPWHWRQTDAWYYTLSGTKKRVPLFDGEGRRIRGKEKKQAAQRARARIRVAGDDAPIASSTTEEWLVARVCSAYIQYCERGVANGSVSADHRDAATAKLNDLCQYCGALPVTQLKKGHIEVWREKHPGWRSPATHRGALAIVLAAFNYAADNYGIGNPLRGLKKPTAQPRLHSLSHEDEKALYGATDQCFRDFLFAALHTGLRPFCELARITAEDMSETPRGMMWRVYSSKTKKTRKVPVRPEVAELSRRLLKSAPAGSGRPLFRNSRGTPWKKVTGVVRFMLLRRKLGWDKDPERKRYSCYSCRHTFAHRMLSGYWNGGTGCSIETLAELLGDTPKVAFDHYGKEWGQHYQEPLWAAIGVAREQVDKPAARQARRKTAPRKKARRTTGKARA